MRVIAIEEHYAHPALRSTEALANLRKHPQLARIQDKLEDVGAGRIADMDEAGIDLQVLSHTVPGAEVLDRERAIPAARSANDDLAKTVSAHPDRFAGFAALPMRDPAAATSELQRAVAELGFRGAMVNGLIEGRFLDDPVFLPVLSKAAELGVPVYLHPSFPPEAVARTYYGGLEPVLADHLATAGWGWHSETAIHLLRLVVSGVFDRISRIAGHCGAFGGNDSLCFGPYRYRAHSGRRPAPAGRRLLPDQYFSDHQRVHDLSAAAVRTVGGGGRPVDLLGGLSIHRQRNRPCLARHRANEPKRPRETRARHGRTAAAVVMRFIKSSSKD